MRAGARGGMIVRQIGILERRCPARCGTDRGTVTVDVAATTQCYPMRHRVDTHAQGCGSEAASTSCVVINVSPY